MHSMLRNNSEHTNCCSLQISNQRLGERFLFSGWSFFILTSSWKINDRTAFAASLELLSATPTTCKSIHTQIERFTHVNKGRQPVVKLKTFSLVTMVLGGLQGHPSLCSPSQLTQKGWRVEEEFVV